MRSPNARKSVPDALLREADEAARRRDPEAQRVTCTSCDGAGAGARKLPLFPGGERLHDPCLDCAGAGCLWSRGDRARWPIWILLPAKCGRPSTIPRSSESSARAPRRARMA